MRVATYKIIPLPTINQPVHNPHNPQPQLQQLALAHIAQQHQIVQEHFAQQGCGAHARLAHAQRIRLVHFWLEELSDEREEDFAEYRGPFFVRGGREVVGEEGALERGEGLLADFAAGVETLVREGFEDGRPVCCPC